MPEARRYPRRPARAQSRSLGDLVRAAIRPSRSQLVLGLVLGLVSFGVVTQVRSRQDATYASMRRADLVQMLDQLNAESGRLDEEIRQLESTKQELSSGVHAQQVAEKEKRKRLDNLRILAGTAAANGPGVRLTISDPRNLVGPEVLLNAIEEMRDAGAEAIEINQTIRVVASTAFTRGGDGLEVDGQTLTRPIVIEVIGNPHDLAEAARFRGGLVSAIEGDQVGGSVRVDEVAALAITAVHSRREPQWARPA